jgi:hypothetical protein
VLVARLIPLACALAVYFATPHHAGTGVFLNVRLAPLLAIFALPVLRADANERVTRVALAGGAAAAIVMSAVSAREIVRADEEEMAGFDELIGRMPRGARVVALNFDTSSEHGRFAPWLYAVAYHRIRNGGVTAYSFAAFDHWPLRYAAGAAPPAKRELFWATNPCVFRNAEDGPYYDYVLVRGEVDPFIDEPPGPRFTLVGRASAFRLHAKTNAEPWPAGSDAGAEPDRGPCARRP